MEHVIGRQLAYAVHEGIQKSTLDGGFDLGTREPVGRRGQCLKLEGVRVACSFGEMDAKDRHAVLWGREVHENDLAEATLANLLGGELAHIVRGGEDKDVGLVLHPVEQEADGPGCLAAVRASRRLEATDAFFELGQAKNSLERRGNAQGAADARGRRADHAAALAHDSW